ncbi:hypothetical protein RJT34_08380 [Clitoria ternatea]|uniref:Uncharacterized protein n=1 Tax=Clitoria ternatea TaxID=43366 RepID=A0AAN9K6G7_CLITE
MGFAVTCCGPKKATPSAFISVKSNRSIHMNKVLLFTLADVSQAICVSYTSKENTVLRSGLPPEKVFAVPNAVDTASRLVYQKGVDLLIEVVPEVCQLHPNVLMIIGGDGRHNCVRL